MCRKALLQLLLPMCIAAYGYAQETLNAGDYFGDLKARHLGPALMSGRITDIELHPKNSRIVLVGAAGGGIWKSQDGGVKFNPVFDAHCQSIGALAIDPQDPDNTYWAGTGETWTRNSVSVGDGMYKTTDGGKNWTKSGLEKTDRIAAIQIHPRNSSVVYVGALGALWGNSEDRGVYKTEDGGKTWNRILFVNNTTGCSELILDPGNPEVLYAAFWEFRRTAHSFQSGGNNSALYKSSDGGKTWNKLEVGLPKGKMGRIALALAPSNTSVVYAVIEAEKKEEKGLYRSDDAGKTWKFLNGDFELTVRPFYFSRITVDPANPDIIAKCGLSGSISRDGGKTFKNLGSMHPDIHDIVFDRSNSDKMFFATDGGVYRSLDGGSSMEMVECLPVSQFYHVSYDNRHPYYVYGGLQDNNSWFGPSESPGGIEPGDWEPVGRGDGFRVYPHPTDPNIVYSEMQGAEVMWRYDIKKQEIKLIKPYPGEGSPKLRFNWNAAFTTSKHHPDRLYAGSQFLHVSEDRGAAWKIISPDLTTNNKSKQNQEASGGLSADNSGAENHCTIFTIAESPLSDQVIWVGTDDGNLQLTTDGGKNWTNLVKNIPGLPPNTWCYHVEASVHGKGIAYAVFEGHTQNDYRPYVYKTSDFGKTWQSIVTADITTFVRSLQEDYQNPELLFLGAENGLYITLNGGKSWSVFSNNFPRVAVHYLELHPTKNALLAATHGRGIIVLDDISPLRKINASLLTSNLSFFDSDVFVIDEKNNFGGRSQENQFVAPNPSSRAQMRYFLPKRHMFGKMTAEIYDLQGNLVTKADAGKLKGINTIEWGFNATAPKVAKGKSLSFAGAPTVKAGKYLLKITKGNEVFEKQIELAYDKNSGFTLAEREEQQQVTKQLFDFIQDLAYLVFTIEKWEEKANDFQQKQTKPNAGVASMLQELSAIKSLLVVTTGDNYVGAAEPKLREKLNDVYGSINAYPGAPSSTQKENIASLQKQFSEAKARFSKAESGSIQTFRKLLEKNNAAETFKIPEFGEYLKL
ncbi:MAG: VPS10 domain-containing protein [Bacteroidota bacterium]